VTGLLSTKQAEGRIELWQVQLRRTNMALVDSLDRGGGCIKHERLLGREFFFISRQPVEGPFKDVKSRWFEAEGGERKG